MARKKIIAGNWKMNMTPSEAVELVNTLKPLVANDEVDVVFCVPAIDIVPVVEAVKGTNIQVGAENMYLSLIHILNCGLQFYKLRLPFPEDGKVAETAASKHFFRVFQTKACVLGGMGV